MSETNATPETTHLPRAPKRRRWLMWVMFVVVFFSGIVCGSGLTLLHVLRQSRAAIANPDVRVAQGTRWLARRLDLTPEQEAAVRDILREQTIEMNSLRREVWPQATARIEKTEREISAVLTPEQQKKWQEVASQLKRRWMPAAAQPESPRPPPRRLRDRPGQE